MGKRRAATELRRDAEFSAFTAGAAGRLLHSAVLLTGDQAAAEALLTATLARVYADWFRMRAEDPYERARAELIRRFAYRPWWRRPRGGTLDRLTGQERLVVTMRLFEGVAEEQTAAQLGLPTERVRTLCARATATLRSRPTQSPEATSTGAAPAGSHPAAPDPAAADPDHTAFDRTARDRTAHDHTASDRTTHDRTTHGRRTHDRRTRDRRTRDQTASDHTAPERTAHDLPAANPASGHPASSHPASPHPASGPVPGAGAPAPAPHGTPAPPVRTPPPTSTRAAATPGAAASPKPSQTTTRAREGTPGPPTQKVSP